MVSDSENLLDISFFLGGELANMQSVFYNILRCFQWNVWLRLLISTPFYLHIEYAEFINFFFIRVRSFLFSTNALKYNSTIFNQ